MKLLLGLLLCCTLVTRSTQKLSTVDMRKALNQDPMFSHPRWGQEIPQSINLMVPMADVQSTIKFSPKRRRTRPMVRPKGVPDQPLMDLASETKLNDAPQRDLQAGRFIKAGKPMMREQIIGTVARAPLVRTDPNPALIVSPDTPRKPLMESVPIVFAEQRPLMPLGSDPITNTMAAKETPPVLPIAELPSTAIVSQDSFPVPLNKASIVIAETPISKPVVNDRMADKMISNQTPSEQKMKQVSEIKPPNQRPVCPFQIPSFLLPDPDIPQIDFEQTYLIPALRAYLQQSEVCRSRALTVYLDWLLHLRERLFTV